MNKNLAISFMLGAVVSYGVSTASIFDKNEIIVSTGDSAEFININGKNVSRELIVEEMRFRGAISPGAMNDPEVLKNIMNEVILLEVMAQKSIENGLDKSPKVAMSIKKLLASEYRNSKVLPKLKTIVVTEEEIKEKYQDDIKQYSSPNMVKAAVIYKQFPYDESGKNRVIMEEMKSIRKEALLLSPSTKGFGKLAEMHSDNMETKFKNGVMNWISEGAKIYGWEQKIIDAIFKLNKANQLSQIIETKKGLVLLKLLDQNPPKVKPLKVVENTIRNQLLSTKKQQWLTDYYQKLKGNSDIHIEGELASILDQARENSLAQLKGKRSDAAPPIFPVN